MKTCAVPLLALALVHPAAAQTMAQRALTARTPVTMSCVRTAAGGAKNITWQTSYGSGERQNTRNLTYQATIRWSGPAPAKANLDVWFVGTPASGGPDIILDNQFFPDIILQPNVSQTISVTSEDIAHRKTEYKAIGISEREGARLRGCVIQLFMDGQVIRAYSSLSHLQSAMWSDPFGCLTTGQIRPDPAP